MQYHAKKFNVGGDIGQAITILKPDPIFVTLIHDLERLSWSRGAESGEDSRPEAGFYQLRQV